MTTDDDTLRARIERLARAGCGATSAELWQALRPNTTRQATGPVWCRECSDEINDWVPAPCGVEGHNTTRWTGAKPPKLPPLETYARYCTGTPISQDMGVCDDPGCPKHGKWNA